MKWLVKCYVFIFVLEPFKQYLLFRIEAVRGQLVFSGVFPATVGNHKAGNAERSGVAEAPHEHFISGLPALSDIAEQRHLVSGFSVSASRYGGKQTAARNNSGSDTRTSTH